MLVAVALLSAVGYRSLSSRQHHPGPAHMRDRVHAAVPGAKPSIGKIPPPATLPGVGGSTTLSATGPGSLPQTRQFPSPDTAAFRSEMAALWQGVKTDSLPAGLPAFFPEAAYLQVKTVTAPRTDYIDRLLVQFQLDIGAA